MAIVSTEEGSYKEIGDALRARLGSSETFAPSEMAQTIINSISYGVKEIKGSAEENYRDGSVIISAEDVGALPSDGTANRSIADENGNNIAETYERLENVISQGSNTIPVYFDENGIAHSIESYEGNALTSTKLQNPTSMTIGDSTKFVDGSEPVSWSREEIGAMKAVIIQNPGDSDFILEIGY